MATSPPNVEDFAVIRHESDGTVLGFSPATCGRRYPVSAPRPKSFTRPIALCAGRNHPRRGNVRFREGLGAPSMTGMGALPSLVGPTGNGRSPPKPAPSASALGRGRRRRAHKQQTLRNCRSGQEEDEMGTFGVRPSNPRAAALECRTHGGSETRGVSATLEIKMGSGHESALTDRLAGTGPELCGQQ